MRLFALIALAGLTACQTAGLPADSVDTAQAAHPAAELYRPDISDSLYEQEVGMVLASLDIDADDVPHKALLIFGANWCHDSRALAGWLADPRFERFGADFTMAFIDVGHPQEGKGRNEKLLSRFGIEDLESTPALVVVDADGKRLNTLADALSWRNAASRSEADIVQALEGYAELEPAG